jgi:hypothetical protein
MTPDVCADESDIRFHHFTVIQTSLRRNSDEAVMNRAAPDRFFATQGGARVRAKSHIR